MSSTFAIYAINTNAILSSDQLDFLLDKSKIEKTPQTASQVSCIKLVWLHRHLISLYRNHCLSVHTDLLAYIIFFLLIFFVSFRFISSRIA